MLIMLDLDGTLLDNQSKITTKTKTYIKSLKDKGHQIVLITGRPYRGCIDYYNELNLDAPLVCDNGASIYGMGHFPNIFHRIPKTLLDEIYQFSKDHIETAFYSVDDDLYAIKPQLRLSFYFHLNKDSKIIKKPYDELDVLAPLLMIVIKKPFDQTFEKFIASKEILALRSWGSDKKNAIYEVYLKGIHKGNALNEVKQALGVKEVIAFGDGDNDVELLSNACLGIAMRNASDSVILASDQQTTYTNNEDGVIKHLKTIIKD